VRRRLLYTDTTSCSSRSYVSLATALAARFHAEAHTGMAEHGELGVMALAGVLIDSRGFKGGRASASIDSIREDWRRLWGLGGEGCEWFSGSDSRGFEGVQFLELAIHLEGREHGELWFFACLFCFVAELPCHP
jgi:hypothetical protein